MKHIFYKNYYKSYTNFLSKKVWIILLCLAFLLYSCDLPSSSSGSLTFPPSVTKAQAQRALENIQTKYAGNMSALYQAEAGGISSGDNILLIAPGGPEFDFKKAHIADNGIGAPLERFSKYKDSSYTLVAVKQGQMLRPGIANRTVVPTEAQAINLESIAILYTLAKNFQDNGHKVSLFASSWGAFLAAEMLRLYNDSPFKKLLIARGRLNMPKEIGDARAIGIQKQFKDGTNVVQIVRNSPPSSEDLARFVIQADLNRNQYTKLLSGKISKVIYYFGGIDINTGRLTDEEVQFLTGNNAFRFVNGGDKTKTKTMKFYLLRWIGNENRVKNRLCSAPSPLKTPPCVLQRTLHTVNATSNTHATVKFDKDEGHGITSLQDEIKQDMIASFR